MPRSTLMRSPGVDPSKSPIENVLELTALSDIGPDVFTNARELWHPPGARGIFGGAVIAQSLSAAQKTIPPPTPINGNATFLIHSMHCYFVLAGDSTIPILYHVERVREGKSFMTRTVQARQRGKCIFTTTCSFMREGSGGHKVVEHEWGLPEDAVDALEARLKENEPVEAAGRFAVIRLGIINWSSPNPHMKKTRQWARAYGPISPSGGQDAHLSALAYMSDNWLIGTIGRVHSLWPSSAYKPSSSPSSSSSTKSTLFTSLAKASPSRLAALEAVEKTASDPLTPRPTIGIMVSLDHSIYFHRPREVVADEWILAENQTPWTGEGRGLVMQRIWGRGGRLLATCVQEGLIRLKQDDHPKEAATSKL